MKREDVLQSTEYWVTTIQTELYKCAMQYMEDEKINRKQLAERLGVSKSYITQLLNGDFDHRLSKLVELSIAFGYIPKMEFIKYNDFIIFEKSKNQEIESISKKACYKDTKDYDTFCAERDPKYKNVL